MKKHRVFAVMAAVMLSGCAGAPAPASGADGEGTDIILSESAETVPTETVTESQCITVMSTENGGEEMTEASAETVTGAVTEAITENVTETAETVAAVRISPEEELLNGIKTHICLGEYGKAVLLAEENGALISENGDMFAPALDYIYYCYCRAAKEYYTAAATRFTVAYVKYGGLDELEGYDSGNKLLDPSAVSELVTDTARNAAARTEIYVSSDDMNDLRFRVTIKICGREAVFSEDTPLPVEPSADINDLLPERINAGGELGEQIGQLLDGGKYDEAAALMEEHSEECSGAEFDSLRTAVLIHYTDTAKNYRMAAATYITRQNIEGYDFSTGFEGYDPDTGSLDPAVLAELIDGDRSAADNAYRVKIVCGDNGDIKVSIDVCGIRAVYPAEDAVLR